MEQDIKRYVSTIASRIGHAEEGLKQLTALESERGERVENLHGRLKEEFAQHEKELRMMEVQLGDLLRHAATTIRSFHDVLHEREFARLRQRIEEWQGERFITREELKRWLKEERVARN